VKQFILKTPPDKNGRILLKGSDYRYLVQARRLAPGEYFPVLLPDGGKGAVRVLSIENHALAGELVSQAAPPLEQPSLLPPIILFQAIPKSGTMASIVRQAAESGLSEIVPFVSEFSSVRTVSGNVLNHSRWERIVKEARQQSGSLTATSVLAPMQIDALFAYWEQIQNKQTKTVGVFFHHIPLANASLHGYLKDRPKTVVLAVGPEGGFSESEARRFMNAGFSPFTIGDTVLRTDTAALYAQASVRILLLEKDSWKMQ